VPLNCDNSKTDCDRSGVQVVPDMTTCYGMTILADSLAAQIPHFSSNNSRIAMESDTPV